MEQNEKDHAGGQNEGDEQFNKELTLPEIDPENATVEQVEEVIKIAKTALGQKTHWREKAVDKETGKPYRDLLADARKAPPAPVNAPVTTERTTALEKDISDLKLAEEKRQFGHEHSLSPDETDRVFGYAKGVAKKPVEVLEDPFIKTGLQAFRQQNRATAGTPGASRRSPMVEGKSFHELPPEDRRKNFESVVGGLQQGRRNR